MSEEQPHLKVTQSEGASVVEFLDRKILEEFTINEIGDQLSTLVGAGGGKLRLLLNFRNVEHLSSAALGMLIKLHNEMKKTGGKLRLSDINPQIFEVFKITRLNKLFEIYDTRAEALRSF